MSRHIVKSHSWNAALGVMDFEELNFDTWAEAKAYAESQTTSDWVKIYDTYGQLIHHIHNTPENTYA